MRSAEVLLLGWYGRGNLGDDALLHVVMEWIRSAPGQYRVYFNAPNESYIYQQYPMAQRVETMEARPVCIYVGGTQWFSFGQGQRKKVGLGSGYSRFCRAAAAIGIGIGPFFVEDAMQAAYQQLVKCETLIVRDHHSLALTRAWGMNWARLAPDLVYHLTPRVVRANGVAGAVSRIKVVVRDWTWEPEKMKYLDSLVHFARRWRDGGGELTFCSVQYGGDDACRRMLEDRGERLVFWNPQEAIPESFFSFWTDADLVITARAHGALVPAMLGIPSLCIGLELKLGVVAKQLGIGSALISPFASVDDIARWVDEMACDVMSRRAFLREQSLRNAELLEGVRSELTRFLVDNSPY